MTKISALCGSLLSLSFLGAHGATTLPTPPSGYVWSLVTTGTYDSQVFETTSVAVETSLETALGLSSSDFTDLSDTTGQVQYSAVLTAFDCGLAPAGQTFLITSNTYAASLSVTSSAYASYISGPTGLVLVSHSLGDIQIASSLGASPAEAAATSAGSSSGFVLTSSITAATAIGGPMIQANGESVNFTFSATSDLDVRGIPLPSEQYYGTLPAVDVSLRRDTIYDTYELVMIPEASTSLLAVLGCSTLLMRRRRA